MKQNKIQTGERGDSMNKQQGFSLIELLIVVAIIAIIAAIAVPSMLTSRMAANEAGAIQGCRTAGSAEAAYAAVNNQVFAAKTTLVDQHYLDDRYAAGFNGYGYDDNGTTDGATTFSFIADSTSGGGRYQYMIGPDQVVRYHGQASGYTGNFSAPKCGTDDCVDGDGIGASASSGS
jgi:prepilin-type N-terminal cleavage/methylation domain-containing protein